MKSIIRIIIWLPILLFFVCANKFSYAQSLSSTELIEGFAQYDGELITYQGEVIGDIMIRGEYAWINVSDGRQAIGVWLNKDLLKDIEYVGRYQIRGDIVEINGIFHFACPLHGGDLDIHASSLKKIAAGRQLNEPLITGKKNIALVLIGVLCLILILTRLK